MAEKVLFSLPLKENEFLFSELLWYFLYCISVFGCFMISSLKSAVNRWSCNHEQNNASRLGQGGRGDVT